MCSVAEHPFLLPLDAKIPAPAVLHSYTGEKGESEMVFRPALCLVNHFTAHSDSISSKKLMNSILLDLDSNRAFSYKHY